MSKLKQTTRLISRHMISYGKMKGKLLVTALFLVVVLINPVLADNDENSGQTPGIEEQRFEATANQLSLNSEQKEKVISLRQKQRKTLQALWQQLQAKRQQMRAELDKASVTRASIAPLVDEIKSIQAKIIDVRIDNIFAIKEMLSSEQIERLRKFQEKRNAPGQDRRQLWLEQRRQNKAQKQQAE